VGSYDPGLDAWSMAPHVPGYQRKGGAGATVGAAVYYGTGIAGDIRLKDWWRFTGAVGIAEQDRETRVLYPDPATDHVRVSGAAWTDVRQAVLQDLHGRTIRTLDPKQLHGSIPVGDLAVGGYLLVVRTASAEHRLRFFRAAP
jgi:hypothetical protein